MRYSWRWFGPQDPVSIQDVRQTGATDIVSALHHLPNGAVWSIAEIKQRQHEVEWDEQNHEATNLTWSIVESVPVHEDIKKQTGNYLEYIRNYQQTIRNLAECGIKIVIYNFMPIIDWTRTDLAYRLPNGVRALRFDYFEFAAFDLYILQRRAAELDYTTQEQIQARKVFDAMDEATKQRLIRNIIAGLPGAEESFTLEEFNAALEEYREINAERLRSHLFAFLREIMPVADECGVRVAIHPDDPPRAMFGLPRILSNEQDISLLMNNFSSPNCGLNICAGSLGASAANDLEKFIRTWGARIPFVHLRSVQREADGSFYEAEHIAGSTNLAKLIKAVLDVEQQFGHEIIIRPDHGHQMLDDQRKATNPGYSCIGRMKGIAELKGMELAIRTFNY
ncbi:MAG: mannonate dehydratase [Burkholderiales bacterium]|nr:mannonate dehydratase [Burkholderiales bacterium]MBP9769373.1 mannonate dehydratase [Burkholderiales bacterium]